MKIKMLASAEGKRRAIRAYMKGWSSLYAELALWIGVLVSLMTSFWDSMD
ncbi:hypothetical protein NE897_06330 [Yersinia ruckeri]|nr:hypothetical protein [Yersinia ruckeri]EKN3344967.1 hypothetical protein [Yersinia ruckeri]EKN3360385.1 hypothetical protein [Yersinia ruckeri]EKN4200123.1 hypothetical protein [Yersinia ruckeri]EKN4724556.1 hypothetical protein [Yersinia ruckeri]MCK8560367.1 hypothetical protein [Yersinia ruckeri]